MKRHIAARRERNRQIAEKDAANRCTFCRRAFPHGQSELIRALGGHPGFCTDDCKAEAEEARKAREARR